MTPRSPMMPIVPSVRRVSPAATPAAAEVVAMPAGGASRGTGAWPHVELRIEELTLHGFPPGARHAIGDAVQRELTRLIAERGFSPMLAAAGDRATVDGGAFHMTPNTPPERVGVQVARAIHGGLSR